jgi:hypothetical protein
MYIIVVDEIYTGSQSMNEVIDCGGYQPRNSFSYQTVVTKNTKEDLIAYLTTLGIGKTYKVYEGKEVSVTTSITIK